MKSEVMVKEDILNDLDELLFLSKFIVYEHYGHDSKKLRKKLKKLIKLVKNDKVNKYLSEEYLESEGYD